MSLAILFHYLMLNMFRMLIHPKHVEDLCGLGMGLVALSSLLVTEFRVC